VQQGEAMMLGRYRQPPGDRRKRGIDYTDFLEDSEKVTSVVPTVTPVDSFLITNIAIDPAGKEWAYFSEGGVDGVTYSVSFRVGTNGGQVKNDTVEFDIEEDE
jgi:hypothetical protein